MFKDRRILLAAFLALQIVLAGCGGGGGGGQPAPPVVYTPNYIASLNNLLHWQTLPVKVGFQLPSNWTDFYSSSLPANAALSWNEPGEQAFFEVVSTGNADFLVSWVDNPLPEWGPSAIGQTDYTYNQNLSMMVPGTVSVVISAHDHYGHLQTAQEMQECIAHELGPSWA